MFALIEILFVLAIIASMISNFFGVPGNLLIVFNSFVYGLITDFALFSMAFVLTLLIIVIAVEFLEYLLIVTTARKYGASKWGISGSIIGGIAGAISGAFVTPVLGAIIGSVIGVFLGATVLEFFRSYKIRQAIVAGTGAFLGKVGGLSIKTCAAVTMIIMIGYKIY